MFENSLKHINHLLNAHQIWNNRIDPKLVTSGVLDFHNTKDLKNIDKTNYEQTLQIIEKFDLTESISYSNSKGNAINNNNRDILISGHQSFFLS